MSLPPARAGAGGGGQPGSDATHLVSPTARLRGRLFVPSFSQTMLRGVGGAQTSGPHQARPWTLRDGRRVVGSELGQTSGVCECGVLPGRLARAQLWSLILLGSIRHLLRRGRGRARPWGRDGQGWAWVCRAGVGRGRGLAQNKSQGHRPATGGVPGRAHLVEFLMAVHLVFVHERQQDPVTQERALGQQDQQVRAREPPPPAPAPARISLPPRWRSVLWPD